MIHINIWSNEDGQLTEKGPPPVSSHLHPKQTTEGRRYGMRLNKDAIVAYLRWYGSIRKGWSRRRYPEAVEREMKRTRGEGRTEEGPGYDPWPCCKLFFLWGAFDFCMKFSLYDIGSTPEESVNGGKAVTLFASLMPAWWTTVLRCFPPDTSSILCEVVMR